MAHDQEFSLAMHTWEIPKPRYSSVPEYRNHEITAPCGSANILTNSNDDPAIGNRSRGRPP